MASSKININSTNHEIYAHSLVDDGLTLTDQGSATQPVYFKDGVPVSTTYALDKEVPNITY